MNGTKKFMTGGADRLRMGLELCRTERRACASAYVLDAYAYAYFSGYIYVHVCLGALYAFSCVLDSYAYAYVSLHTRMRVWVHTCMRMWGAYGSVFLFRNFVMFSQSEKFSKSGKSSIGRFRNVAKSGYKPHVKV